MANLELLFGLVPALILFLYGVEHFSKEVQNIAGDKFRSLISKLTKTPLRGAFLGAIVTAIIQSSSATTVITVSLVNAGIISFSQSLGVILGAHVGTTITAQLVALKLTAFAPIFILVGFLLRFFGGKYKIIGKPVFFFGIVFYGLMLVSLAIEPIKTDPNIVILFSSLSNIFVALAVGFIFTAIVQSSSVTTGLVVVLAQSGLIDLRMGIPLLLGANIGTGITALLASMGLNLHAKRGAVANIMFNVCGVALFLPILGIFMKLIEFLGGSVAQQIANAHVIFNIIISALFLIGIGYFRKMILKLIPGKEKEILFKTKYLGDDLPEDNTRAMKLIKKELIYSLEITLKIYKEALKMFKYPKKMGFMMMDKLESLNDFLDDQITDAILQVSRRKLSPVEAKKTVLLVQISNAIEQLGDLGDDLGDVSKDLFDTGRNMPYDSIEVVDKIFKEFQQNVILLKSSFPNMGQKVRDKIKAGEDRILDMITQRYEEHLVRLQMGSHYHGSTFVESISIMESSVSKLREIRKLSRNYSRLKRIEE